MGVLGSLLGGLAGNIGSQLFPIQGINGGQLGQSLGSMLPFARGGSVPAHKIMGYARGGDIVVVPQRAYQRGGRVKKSKSKSKPRK